MKRNNLLAKFIITLTLVSLLTIPVGRVTGVFALAEEITPELEPVYDTEVVSLQDYVDNVLTDAQVAVFNILLGSYVASQAGLNEYDLEYPYADRSGVIGWLQDAGMRLYNAIITGGSFDLVTGTDLRTYIVTAASYAIGMAQKAHSYSDVDNFLADVDNSTHYFIPIDPILQASINSYFGRDYGLWNWQFQMKPFETTVDYHSTSMTQGVSSNYWTYLGDYTLRSNHGSTSRYNYRYSSDAFNIYTNLFFDTDDGRVYMVSDSGEFYYTSNLKTAYVNSTGTVLSTAMLNDIQYPLEYKNTSELVSYANSTLLTADTYLAAIRDFYNSTHLSGLCFWQDIIDHVYVGSNWAIKQEIFNIDDLNFAQNDSPSYNQVPDNSYIDLKGFLTDIVNNTNILNVILDNLFKPDGTLNVDPALIKVSITIPDTNPLPVNLNDIQYYTENEYLDVVRERVDAFSDTVGSFVAFWHNTDYEIVYAVFGSALIVLLGAFIGKWGHS